MKTREHFKKAISRIVELEQKEVKNSERINQLELKTCHSPLQAGSIGESCARRRGHRFTEQEMGENEQERQG